MFGLGIGPVILWRKVQGEPKVQQIEHEIVSAANHMVQYLIVKHGAEAIHIAMSVGFPLIKSLLGNTEMKGAQKKELVAGAMNQAIDQFGKTFDQRDIDQLIAIGLGAAEASLLPPAELPPAA